MKNFLIAILLFFTLPAHAERCQIGGCSGEICEEARGGPMVGNCIWAEHFTCFKTAKCEVQKNGACGWTQTPELKKCIAEKKQLSSPLRDDR
jgi:eight-cysteine-cluster-containing protein